ncbi:unnamed protein product [Menidia menidia]|uniref:(Atlantic silverside) hypothetical protein n=1 Tax=Menidia menidia TaxID=238744 RepID=A0A8S4BF47_9TELE|nr:unnamed protein product [Menidia menidia]
MTVWHSSCTEAERKRLQRVTNTAQKIIGCPQPSLTAIYNSRCLSRARNILRDATHPGFHLFNLLPSGRRFRLLTFQGLFKFKCPALKEGTLQQCGALWPYQEVRRLAVLTAQEMHDFEQKIARLAASEFCDFKSVSETRTSPKKAQLLY